jgi:lipoprotein-releasing system permease protein
MYKVLLSWRYLKSRYIALASIVSVTLGVATLIVVNSVMAGFTVEMHDRLHGILSDIVVRSHNLNGLPDSEWHMEEIRKVAGDDIEAMTATVSVPAMINFRDNIRGQWITQPINLIGIDATTYSDVSEFEQHLLHPLNREQMEFLLRENDYGRGRKDKFPVAGWARRRVAAQWEQREIADQVENGDVTSNDDALTTPPPFELVDDSQTPAGLPALPDSIEELPELQGLLDNGPSGVGRPDSLPAVPFQTDDAPQLTFDAAREQHTGIVLGISICSLRGRDVHGDLMDYYFALPGDDVKITFPNTGQPPKAVSDSFTIVDFYESEMSEYDSSFAFVPLSKLQNLRGMIAAETGVASVSAIQIKLRAGADLDMIRDRLQARFPLQQFGYQIQTWRDMQGPLLSAVQLETTILNILLFLIIAVAGFGILATFFMIVVEKTRDVGILKSLGAPSRGVMSIFLGYGLSLGIAGSLAGLALGLLFVDQINVVAGWIEKVTGQEVFDPTVYYFSEIPVVVNPLTCLWVVLGAVGIAVIASVLPARKAAKLHPVEALRYE